MPVKISGAKAPASAAFSAPANSTPNMETDSLITPGMEIAMGMVFDDTAMLAEDGGVLDLGAMTTAGDPRIDRLAELLKWQEGIKADARTKELADLVKTLKAEVPADLDPDADYVFEGEKHRYVFGAASKDRYVADMEAVKAAFGEKVFMELVKVNLTDLDKYLTPDQLADLIAYSRGSRKASMLTKPGE